MGGDRRGREGGEERGETVREGKRGRAPQGWFTPMSEILKNTLLTLITARVGRGRFDFGLSRV